MIERIKSALDRCGITLWRINERLDETAELFFVKKELDTRRTKDVHKYEVTVFRDVEAEDGGKPQRGFTSVMLIASMDDAQIDEELKGAYYAARFAANPCFDMPDPVQAPLVEEAGELAEAPLARSAGKMAKALFAPDVHEDAFVNSAELFVWRVRRRILSSEGTDVSFVNSGVDGEFVVQCREPEDVEMYHSVAYDKLDEAALTAKVAEALTFVRDGAQRKPGEHGAVLLLEPLRGPHGVRQVFHLAAGGGRPGGDKGRAAESHPPGVPSLQRGGHSDDGAVSAGGRKAEGLAWPQPLLPLSRREAHGLDEEAVLRQRHGGF